ncbi:MAG: TonB family protein [Bryobacteraceae bacterium]
MKRALSASLVLHTLALALVFTIRTPETPRVRFAGVTQIASPYRAPALVKSAEHVQPHGPPRIAARTFRVPDRLPQLAPRERPPVLSAPPSIQEAPILVPAPTLGIADIPPPEVRRIVAATKVFDATIPANQAVSHTAVSIGTFGDATTAAAGSRSGRASDVPISSAAEILFKPHPAYTDEARRLRIEGEVLLEVLFGASGDARVLRIIRGLGHGLDENAVAAAREIRFRPAKRGDRPADSMAVVHIVFQLAY